MPEKERKIMKKLICWTLAVLMLLGLTTAAYAAETTCTVSADSVTAGAGEEVTVSIRLTGNPGFTNFGIFLDYDREKLTLVEVEDVAGEISGGNLQWEDPEGKERCYVTSASASAVTGDIVLFTAKFTTAEDFTGTAQVTPEVHYIRNNTAVFSVFEEITATVESGTVGEGNDVLLGDVNGDGTVTMKDMQMIYNAATGQLVLTAAQEKAADANGDGEVTMKDMQLVYKHCTGMIEDFPGKS